MFTLVPRLFVTISRCLSVQPFQLLRCRLEAKMAGAIHGLGGLGKIFLVSSEIVVGLEQLPLKTPFKVINSSRQAILSQCEADPGSVDTPAKSETER